MISTVCEDDRHSLHRMYKAFCNETGTFENPSFIEGTLANNGHNLELIYKPDKYFCLVQYIQNYNYLVALYVVPELRRCGIGTHLIRKWADPMFCKVHKDNLVAANFYQGLGFTQLTGESADDPACNWFFYGSESDARKCSLIIAIINLLQNFHCLNA